MSKRRTSRSAARLFSISGRKGNWKTIGCVRRFSMNKQMKSKIPIPVLFATGVAGVLGYVHFNHYYLDTREICDEREEFDKRCSRVSISTHEKVMSVEECFGYLSDKDYTFNGREELLLHEFLKDREELSFTEYLVLKAFLSTSEREFKEAVAKFISKDTGSVTKREFVEIIHSILQTDNSLELENQPLIATLFIGSDELHLDSFLAKLSSFKAAFCTLEYQLLCASDEREDYLRKVPHWLSKLLDNSEALNSSNFLYKFSAYMGSIRSYVMEHTSSLDSTLSKSSFVLYVQQLMGNEVDVADCATLFSLLDVNNSGELDINTHIHLAGMDVSSSKSSSSSGSSPSSSKADGKGGSGIPKYEAGPILTMAMAGSSAMIGASTVYPIDKAKTRLQSSQKPQKNVAKALYRVLSRVHRNEGFRGLYRGLLPQLIGITPEKALKLTVNEFLRRSLRDKDGKLTTYRELLAGVGTGCIQISVTNPYEIVKIRMQMQKGRVLQKGIVQIVRELGLRGLYTGLAATFWRDVPFNALYFTSYAFFRSKLASPDGSVGLGAHLAGACGAGVLAAALDTPADTIKTRLQNGKFKYTGFYDALTTILREEGAGALLKGMLPRVLIISPLFAITFASYEGMKRLASHLN